jgi:hypothetical protein
MIAEIPKTDFNRLRDNKRRKRVYKNFMKNVYINNSRKHVYKTTSENVCKNNFRKRVKNLKKHVQK